MTVHDRRAGRGLALGVSLGLLAVACSPDGGPEDDARFADEQPRSPAAAEPGPLRVADVLELAEFADRVPIALSPDGRLVAFTLRDRRRAAETEGGRYFDDRGVPRSQWGTDLYVTDVETGETRRLSDGRGASWGPVWSPDGRRFAFYSDRDGLARAWLWDRTRDAMERLSDQVVRPFWGFEQMHWSPDGGRLLVKLLPEGASFADLERLYPTDAAEPSREPDSDGVTARTFRHSPASGSPEDAASAASSLPDLDSTRSFLNVQLGDLALVDVPSGRTRRIAGGVRAMGARFSPSGDRVAFSTRQPDGGQGVLVYDRYDLWVVDADGGPVRPLASVAVQPYGLGFAWSPDGRRLAYASNDTVRVVRAADGAAVHSFAREGVSFGHDYRPPLWLDPGTLVVAARDTVWSLSVATGSVAPAASPPNRRLRALVASADRQHLPGPGIVVAVSDRLSKRMGFHALDLASGASTPLWEADVALGATDLPYNLAGAPDGDRTVFVAESGARPSDLWVADGQRERVRPLTDLHPTVSGRELGRSRLVQWTDAGGRELQGALLLPAGYEEGRRYPLVVRVYGGSRLSGQVNRFGLEPGVDNLQLLATRGYAALLPDAPTRVGTPMQNIADAVLAGVDAVVDMGVADPERLALLGQSYGGYSVLGLAVASPRFRAVISSAGFSNLFSHYSEMRDDGSAVWVPWTEDGQGRMGGHPWEHPERYRDNSPFFFLDRVTAPVLLLHGGSDRTVTQQRARETFVALRRLDKEATLVVYEGEGHHPGGWSVANATDYWERIFDWLKRHLEPEAAR